MDKDKFLQLIQDITLAFNLKYLSKFLIAQHRFLASGSTCVAFSAYFANISRCITSG